MLTNRSEDRPSPQTPVAMARPTSSPSTALRAAALADASATDMAVAAMLLPLGVGLLRDSGLRPRESNVGRAVMIATAFAKLRADGPSGRVSTIGD